jgi:hypothetical protein
MHLDDNHFGAVPDQLVICRTCGNERAHMKQECCEKTKLELHNVMQYACGGVEFYEPLTGKFHPGPCKKTLVRLN